MEHYKDARALIDAANDIVILQADNPDGDSLASALALEAILADMGKHPILVCGIDMPAHLKYLSGWDRVEKDVPQKFDASIIVDASTLGLFETLDKNGQLGWVKSKPVLVLDHHMTSTGIEYADVSIIEEAVSTGEIIYKLAKDQQLPLSLDAMNFIAVSIMSDSLGLTSEGTTVNAIRTIADIVEAGVSLAELDAARRELMKREPELLPYKGKLLQRVEFHGEGRITTVEIPWDEIERYSSLYNPSMLALDDMRMTIGVLVCIAFKVYNNGRVTAKIRCLPGGLIADKLAAAFGGGGHPYAAGFKVIKCDDFHSLKADTIKKAVELLKELPQ
jgi:phosphoesterase RecJ-like protein